MIERNRGEFSLAVKILISFDWLSIIILIVWEMVQFIQEALERQAILVLHCKFDQSHKIVALVNQSKGIFPFYVYYFN